MLEGSLVLTNFCSFAQLRGAFWCLSAKCFIIVHSHRSRHNTVILDLLSIKWQTATVSN